MKLKRNILALSITLAFSTAVSAANIILEGDYVKIGVNESSGTLGSGGNTSPGILYDSTGAGAFNTSYDYLTPGSPYEGWSVFFNSDTRVHNNNTGAIALTGGVLTDYSGVEYAGETFDNRAVWANTGHASFDILHDYKFNDDQQFVDISTALTAKADLTDLYFARFTDPDARAAAGDSSSTDNVLGYGVIPTTQVVFSEALVSRYALGLYSADTNVNTAITSPWSNQAEAYYTGTTPYGTGVTYGQGDDAIGMGWYIASLTTGSTATFSYSYIFGPSAFAASTTAVEAGAGGGTPGEVPGCVSDCDGGVVDVGSATDAAAGSSEPTVVSTSVDYTVESVTIDTPSYNYLDPSNAIALTAGGLTVTRTLTTETTVTSNTTTATTPVTTTNWSDSTTTTSTGSAVITTSSSSAMTSADVTQTASAKVDTFANSQHLNLFAMEMMMPDPLSRIDLSGDVINKRAGEQRDISDDSWTWLNVRRASGNESRAYGIELGGEKLVDEASLVGAQVNYNKSTMTEVEDGSGRFDTTMVNLYAVRKIGDWAVKPMIGYARTNYDTSRTITFDSVENFANEAYHNKLSTSGNSYWADLQVIAPKLGMVTPYAGVGIQHYKTDGDTESGSELTALTWKTHSDTVTKPYVGARFDSDVTERGLFYSVDGRITRLNLDNPGNKEGWTTVESKYGETLATVKGTVGYKVNEQARAWAGVQHQNASGYNNNIFTIGLTWEF